MPTYLVGQKVLEMYKTLQSPEFMRDPFPTLAHLQGQGPLVASKIPILGKVWFTTNQAAAAEVLKDAGRFPVRKPDGKVVGLSWWMPKFITRLASNMLASDEPEHTRLRRIVDHAFQRRAVAEMEPLIEALALKQRRNLFSEGSPADLVSWFARPFPLAVICELLGLPETDHEKFSRWASGITNVGGVISLLFAIRRLRPLTQYIENRIEHERRFGGHGLIHEMVQDPDSDLSDDELLAMVFLLLLAGHETTTYLIAGGVLALLANPDQLKLLQKDHGLLDLAVEELLRFVSPVQMTKPRYVAQDCEIQGVSLQSGEVVMPLLVAANADPLVFDEPEKLNLLRKPNRHMEFGTGIHFCLGHQLARMEMKAALKVLLLEDEAVSLAVKLEDVQWNNRLGVRALKELRIKT